MCLDCGCHDLSFSLEVELTGMWPWERGRTETRMGLPPLWRRDNPVDPLAEIQRDDWAGAPCEGTLRLNMVE